MSEFHLLFAVACILLLLVQEMSASRRDGEMFITSVALDFLEPSFSKASLMPASATFSLLKSSDSSISNLCSSHIIPSQPFLFTDPVGEGMCVFPHVGLPVHTTNLE
jgi:hypothetical protein